MHLGRVTCMYSWRVITFPSAPVSTLHKSGFLQWSKTTSTFRKAWVSFLVTWLTVKVWKYSWSGTDVWGLSSLWSRASRPWKCFFLPGFSFGDFGRFWRPCLFFPLLSDFDETTDFPPVILFSTCTTFWTRSWTKRSLGNVVLSATTSTQTNNGTAGPDGRITI